MSGQVPDKPWQVTALRYATRPTKRSDVFYRYAEYGEPDGPQEMAYYFWLLQNGNRNVLVDSGFSETGGVRRGRSYLVKPIEALSRCGVTPKDIDFVIVTHLHYDHTGFLCEFDDVPMAVSATELDVWTSPMAARAQLAAHIEPAEIEHLAARRRAGKLELLSGEREVLDGVLSIEVGGHSPGQTILRVETATGPVILASDAAHFYEEVESDRACGVLVDLAKVYGAYDRLRELTQDVGAQLVPGHDPLVMERFAPLTGSDPALGVRVDLPVV